MLRLCMFVLLTVVTLCCCDRQFKTEAEVIGTWQSNSADAIVRLTFTSDHRVSLCFPDTDNENCEPSMEINGRWWLQHDNVIYKLDSTPLKQFGDVPPDKEQKIPLARFRERTSPSVAPYFRRVK
jgi:hypothetical protein